MRASEGRPASRGQHMMDCCVRPREIEGESRGEGMEGRQELFTEGRLGGRGWTGGMRGEACEMAGELLRRGSIKRREKEDDCETEMERKMRAGGDSRVSSSLLMAKEQRGSY